MYIQEWLLIVNSRSAETRTTIVLINNYDMGKNVTKVPIETDNMNDIMNRNPSS